MDRVVRCECGFEARAPEAKELVAQIRRHAWEAHGMPLSENEALALADRDSATTSRETRTKGGFR